jgi:hypothetical protein
MFTKENIHEILKKILIDYKFQLPIAWVWVGVNGVFLTGRIEVSKGSKEFRSVTLSGNPKKLRFPVNVMFVDSRGQAAHVLSRGAGEGDDELNRLRVDEPPPAGPLAWPTGCGKA